MTETTLRGLAKAFAKKKLQQEDYREARAKYINGILSGEIKLTVNKYPPMVRPIADESQEVTVRRKDKKKTP